METLGLMEWTSRWLRVWQRQGSSAWLPVVIQGPHPQLPLALCYRPDRAQSWLSRTMSSFFGLTSPWQIGWPAWQYRSLHPSQVLTDFLSSWRLRHAWWVNGKQISAKKLLGLFVKPLLSLRRHIADWIVMLPSYWDEEQAHEFADQLGSIGFSSLIAQPQDLALARGAWLQHGPCSAPILADVDDHALVVTRVTFRDPDLLIEHRRVVPELGRRIWLARLMRACSELSLRISRCDPLLSREASHCLELQLNDALPLLDQQSFSIHLHVSDFHGELELTPELSRRACHGLARACAKLIRGLTPTPAEVFLSQRLANLPGLVRAVYQAFGHRQPVFVVDESHYLESASWFINVQSDTKPTLIWHHVRCGQDWFKSH